MGGFPPNTDAVGGIPTMDAHLKPGRSDATNTVVFRCPLTFSFHVGAAHEENM